jgi:hypothetical protein
VLYCLPKMATHYTGRMDNATTFSAAKPFVVVGLPSPADIKTFDTEQEAKAFVTNAKKGDKFAAIVRVYGFSGGRWIRL